MYSKQEQKGGYYRGTERQKESPLCYIDGHLSSQKYGVRAVIPEVQKVESYFEETLGKTPQEHTQYLLNKTHLLHK